MEALLAKEVVVSKNLWRTGAVVTGILLTALGAFVRIPLPFSPVPVTMQTFFVLLGGALVGARLSCLTQGGYLLLGTAGFPVFTGALAGAFYLTGPTAGYLIGFVPAGILAGLLMGRRSLPYWRAAGCLLLADAVVFICGFLWLKVLTGGSFAQVMLIGVIPFIPGEFAKIAAAAAVYRRLHPRMREIL